MTAPAQERFVADRLWPVLTALVALIATAIALEILATQREPAAEVISIRASALEPEESDDGTTDSEGGPSLEEQSPVSPEHAHARVLARRGEISAALAAFAALAQTDPSVAAIRAEHGFWLLVADREDEALTELEQAAALAPGDAWTRMNLAVARLRTGDRALAERDLEHALDLRPGFAQARIVLGGLLRRARRYDEAIRVLEPAASHGGNEERARALVALGRVQLAAGRVETAERSFERAIERAPALPEVRLRIARAWLGASVPGAAERAVAEVEKAIAIAPALSASHVALGRARERLEDVTGARAAYEAAIALDADHRYARRRLVRLALEQRDFARAQMQAEHLLEREADRAENHFLAGLVAARDGRHDEARGHYTRAIELTDQGDYPEAFFNLGLLERDAGALDASVRAYERAIELRADYKQALNNLGLAYAAADRDDEAERAFHRALELDPTYAGAWLNLGRHLAKDAGRLPDAIAAFQRAAEIDRTDAEAQVSLARTLSRADRPEEARAVIRELLARDERSVSAWYELGRIETRAEDLPAALTAFGRALAVDPSHVASLRRSGDVAAELGDLALARRRFQELLDRDSTDRGARLALAAVLERLGDLPGCLREARAAAALLPEGAQPSANTIGLIRRCGEAPSGRGG